LRDNTTTHNKTATAATIEFPPKSTVPTQSRARQLHKTQHNKTATAATIMRKFHWTGTTVPKSRDNTTTHNKKNGNGRNDYAEFSHGEHQKSQLNKTA